MKKSLKILLTILSLLMLLILGVLAAGVLNPDMADTLKNLLHPSDADEIVLPSDEISDGGSSYGPTPTPTQFPQLSNLGNPGGGNLGNIFPDNNNNGDSDVLGDSSDNMPDEGVSAQPSGYTPPDDSSLNIPSDVAGKTGYEEPKEDPITVTQPEARKIEDELSTGETGDGLDFDRLYYPYYHMLDDKGQHLYRQLYANLNALTNRYRPIENCSRSLFKNVFEAVTCDHPELFFINTGYQSVSGPDGRIVEIDPSFNQCAKNLDSAKGKFDNAANEILSAARGASSDFDKEKIVHDALADRIVYSLSAPMNQSAYSALVGGQTVCAGYSRAMQYLMQQLKVPAYYCTGYAGESHAWNIVKLDDDFYNLDLTWDDTGRDKYGYFNKTDAFLNKDHARKNLSIYLPPCNGTGYQVESEVSGTAQAEADEGMQLLPQDDLNTSTYKTLEDLGLTEDDLLYFMDDYYNDCTAQILKNGKGSYSFSNVIHGDDMFAKWKADYTSNAYKSLYLEDAMKSVSSSTCQLSLDAQPLADGNYLITHNIYMR